MSIAERSLVRKDLHTLVRPQFVLVTEFCSFCISFPSNGWVQARGECDIAPSRADLFVRVSPPADGGEAISPATDVGRWLVCLKAFPNCRLLLWDFTILTATLLLHSHCQIPLLGSNRDLLRLSRQRDLLFEILHSSLRLLF